MALPGKKLGLLLSTHPESSAFRHGVNLAQAALDAGVKVYLYCIDEAVFGLRDAQLQSLRSRGLSLYACAFGAQQRRVPLNELAVFSGLAVVSDLMAATDQFLAFN